MEFGDIFGDQAGRGTRAKMRGGPLDGQSIATHLYVKTGRGGKQLHISMPLLADAFNVHSQDRETVGHYQWNDEAGQYWWVKGQVDDLP